jgi:P-type Cu2+ transporter
LNAKSSEERVVVQRAELNGNALGLAIPAVIAISTSLGAQNGLLVKDRLALEGARNLDMVIFNKAGTLTRGSPALSGVVAAPGSNESDLLAHAATVEANSEPPLAKAIVADAKRRHLPALQATDSEALLGGGTRKRQGCHCRWTFGLSV